MKLRPIIFSLPMVQAILDGRKTQTRRVHAKPAYAVGDILWVRENWRPIWWGGDGRWDVQYSDGREYTRSGGLFLNDLDGEREQEFLEKLCETLDAKGCPFDKEENLYKGVHLYMPWKPSIHMPFGAHRIQLQVTDVRQERLQDISVRDAMAEGIELDFEQINPERAFQTLWESINGPGSWEANPLVYVYTFKRIIP